MPTARRRATSTEPVVDLPYIEPSLRPFAVPIESLVPDPENPRIHNQINMEAIIASLTEFGQTIPIVVQREGMIVRIGNGRLEAAKTLGWTHIAAIVTDKPEAAMKALGIADNRTGELAMWDKGELARLLDEMQEIAPELINSVGFDMRDIENMIAQYLPDVAGDSGLVNPSTPATPVDPVFGATTAGEGEEPPNAPQPALSSPFLNVRYINLSYPADDHAKFVEPVRFFGARYETTITPDAVLKALIEFKESIQE